MTTDRPSKHPTGRAKGRPREFCVSQALSKALKVFWRKGYAGTSLSDLTDALEVSRPSLYAAFGNKEELYFKALDQYQDEQLGYIDKALQQPSIRGVVESILRGTLATQLHAPSDAPAFMGLDVLTGGTSEPEVRAEMQRRAESYRRKVEDRFREGTAGEIPEGLTAEGLVSVLFALLQGMSLQGASANEEDMKKLLETSLTLWPTP